MTKVLESQSDDASPSVALLAGFGTVQSLPLWPYEAPPERPIVQDVLRPFTVH